MEECLKEQKEFSQEQIDVSNEIINSYLDGNKWVMLLAQMQSGKTDSFLLTSCEMIRQEYINEVVIFSGSADIDLKAQLCNLIKTNSVFFEKYRYYLSKKLFSKYGPNKMEEFIDYFKIIDNITKYVANCIQIIWGTELKKNKKIYKKTLFVWEESHYAQNYKQMPDLFIQQTGFSANGTLIDEKTDNYFISVSATPFSEICDFINLNQNKKMVYLKPHINYWSIEKMIENKQVRIFEDITYISNILFCDIFNNNAQVHKYNIIRVTPVNCEKVINTIKLLQEENPDKCVQLIFYDSTSSKEEQQLADNIWNNMDKEPLVDTIIIIKERCRMGKNLNKKYIGIMIETSNVSNTDTLLQSLLGRTCGYGEGCQNILIYIRTKKSKGLFDEFNKYIQFCNYMEGNDVKTYENITAVPKYANNILCKYSKQSVPTIPIKIPIHHDQLLNEDGKMDRHKLFNEIICNFNDENYELYNKENVKYNFIKLKFLQNYNNKNTINADKNRIFRCTQQNTKNRTIEIFKKIENAHKNKKNPFLGKGCGCKRDKDVVVWSCKEEKDFVYIIMYLRNNNIFIPQTTKREIYRGNI